MFRKSRSYLFTAMFLGSVAVGLLISSCAFIRGENRVVRDEDFGAWRYNAYLEEDGWTAVRVHYDRTSMDGLNAFVAANRKMGESLSRNRKEPFFAIMTFKRGLSVAEFRQLVSDSGVPINRIKGYEMGGNSAGGIYWFGGKPRPGDLVDEEWLNRDLESQRRRDATSEFLGIVCFWAAVKPDEHRRLVADGRVALVDVTQEVTRDRLRGTPGVNMNKVGFGVGCPFYTIWKFGAEALQ